MNYWVPAARPGSNGQGTALQVPGPTLLLGRVARFGQGGCPRPTGRSLMDRPPSLGRRDHQRGACLTSCACWSPGDLGKTQGFDSLSLERDLGLFISSKFSSDPDLARPRPTPGVAGAWDAPLSDCWGDPGIWAVVCEWLSMRQGQSYIYFFCNVIDFRERGRNINLLFHLLMHSLVDSCVYPDRGSNPQPWHSRTMLQPTELPGQGRASLIQEHFMLSVLLSLPLYILESSSLLLFVEDLRTKCLQVAEAHSKRLK